MLMAHKDFGCGRAECHASMSNAETMTYGTGHLDRNGFWQFPCAVCELANHSRGKSERITTTGRIYYAAPSAEPRDCLFCGHILRNGQEVIDLAGPAIGKIAHSKCNEDAAISGAYA
jgi:hypothetical protein